MRKFNNFSFAIIFFIFGYFFNEYRVVLVWKLNPYLNYFRKPAETCISEKQYIPRNSILIVGHAYGKPINSTSRGDNGISPKLIKLFEDNYSKIDSIVFAGDLLHNPSLKRWSNLFEQLDKFKIYIAPGNHDVGLGKNNAKNDIFKIATKNYSINNEYPFFFIKDKSLFIIDNSTLKNNNLEKIKQIILNKNEFSKIFIIRHHVFTKSMSKFSNGSPLHPLIKEKSFFEEMNTLKDKNIIFIYGDGGDSGKLSLFCKVDGNIKQVISGIGENKDDKILIIKDKYLYFKTL